MLSLKCKIFLTPPTILEIKMEVRSFCLYYKPLTLRDLEIWSTNPSELPRTKYYLNKPDLT